MISVIIPSYNSEKTIEKNLDALLNQTYQDEYEIILVDSSNDRTPAIVNEKFSEIKFIHFNTKTDPGTARNAGVEESKGELILFIDSDCIAAPDWIEKLVSKHKNNNYAAIGGSVMNGNDPKSSIAWAGYFAEFREFIPERPPSEVAHIPTCNISYKTSIFKTSNGFNPNYYPQEDLEFNYRLINSGQKILFYPQATVFHNHRTDLKSFFKHQKNVGQITSKMLKILPIQGSLVVKNIFLTFILLPFLPAVKWIKTILVFIQYNRILILKHIPAIFIFAIGLIPWTFGFYLGVRSGFSEE